MQFLKIMVARPVFGTDFEAVWKPVYAKKTQSSFEQVLESKKNLDSIP
jgi:hypothetical protein